LERWGWTPWSLPFLFNLVLYVTLILLEAWPHLGLGERWLHRAIIAAGFGFGTFGMISHVIGSHHSADSGGGVLEVLLFIAASIGMAVYAFAKKEDLFSFAVLALSWVAITTTMLARALFDNHGDIGSAFLLGMYLIGASTAAVKGILYLAGLWNTQEAQ
jgi:hypothetical protein